MPLFSTIIPSYNRASLIAATLETVFAQDDQDNEIIVVDDGSTDATLSVLAKYKDRIKLLQQRNAGPGAARNLGVANATGDYVAFLDSDDLWFPWTLATFRHVIETHDRPAVVTSTPLSFKDSAPPAYEWDGKVCSKAYPCFYESPRDWHLPSGTTVRRDCFLAVGGFAEAPTEDVDIWLRWGALPGFVQIQSPHLFAYRIHPDSICKTNRYRYDGIRRILAEERAGRYSRYSNNPRHDIARRDYIATNARATSFYCLGRCKLAWAWELYTETLSWHARTGRIKYLLGFPVMALWQMLVAGLRLSGAPERAQPKAG